MDKTAPIIGGLEFDSLAAVNSPLLKYSISENNPYQITLILPEKNLVAPLQLKNSTIPFWGELPSGIYELIFVVADSAGNWASRTISVEKDIDVPSIEFISPRDGSIHKAPPVYKFKVSDNNVKSIRFSINNRSRTILPNQFGEYVVDNAEFPYMYNIIVTVEAWDSLDNYSNYSIVIHHEGAPVDARENTLDLINLFTQIPPEVAMLLGGICLATFVVTVKRKNRTEHVLFLQEDDF